MLRKFSLRTNDGCDMTCAKIIWACKNWRLQRASYFWIFWLLYPNSQAQKGELMQLFRCQCGAISGTGVCIIPEHSSQPWHQWAMGCGTAVTGHTGHEAAPQLLSPAEVHTRLLQSHILHVVLVQPRLSCALQASPQPVQTISIIFPCSRTSELHFTGEGIFICFQGLTFY